MITIETLKENRELIIEMIKSFGLEDRKIEFMEIVKLEVEMKTIETKVEDVVYKVWDAVFRQTSRKTPKWVEARAQAEYEGRVNEFNLRDYLANKNN